MGTFLKKQALGLDIGQARTKGIMLAQNGREPHLAGAEILDYRSEGILDEKELSSELGPWMETCGWRNTEITVGIPQYLATTQTGDFPPGNERNLDEMVAFETRHLAGLSEEAFVYDHQRLPPRLGRQNPVLIGICRESVVRERTDDLLANGLSVADVAISGTALAAAYLQLYPEAAEAQVPQLLVEIGAENTTIVVIAGGLVLFASALMFGVERYVHMVAQHLGVSQEEAQKDIINTRLTPADHDSIYANAARSLALELEGALENWRAQDQTDLAKLQFVRVAVCGGGAHINGIDDFLADTFSCPGEIVGVPLPGREKADPQFMTAYGLALQGIGASPMHISLAPPEIRWQTQRRRQFGILAAAALLLALFIVLLGVHQYQALGDWTEQLDQQLANVQKAQQLVPDLEETLRNIEFRQRTLIPFVEKGNHARRFLLSIKELGAARQAMLDLEDDSSAEGWLVYLADESSFEAGKTGDASSGSRPRRAFRRAPFGRGGSGPGTPGGDDPATVEMETIPVNELQPLKRMVTGIYTTADPGEPFRHVRNFIRIINAPQDKQSAAAANAYLFGGVDIMAERDVAGREDIYQPWVNFLTVADIGSYRRFTLKLPFVTSDVHLPEGE